MKNDDKIKEYSEMYPHELRRFIKCMPKDDIDWAIIMYLFRNTSKGNIITLGKIASYFGLERNDVSARLNGMYWLNDQFITFEYRRPIYIYKISMFGADALSKLMELLEVKTWKKKNIEKI